MKGSTLIETLVYIGLLSILMVGIFSSIYMIIGSAEKTDTTPEKDSVIILQKFHE